MGFCTEWHATTLGNVLANFSRNDPTFVPCYSVFPHGKLLECYHAIVDRLPMLRAGSRNSLEKRNYPGFDDGATRSTLASTGKRRSVLVPAWVRQHSLLTSTSVLIP